MIVTLYMVYYYRIRLNKPTTTGDALLAVIGPLIWPLQIIKHLIDIYKVLKNR